MRAVTVTVTRTKNKKDNKDYICQVFPSFNGFTIVYDCNENKKATEQIKAAAQWALKNNTTKTTIKLK